jgi:hypothetical protein
VDLGNLPQSFLQVEAIMSIQSPLKTTPVTTEFPRSLDIATVSIYGLAILSAGLFLFLPFVNLLHVSPWQRSIGTIHGCAAMLATVVLAYTGHLAFPLLRGSAKQEISRYESGF